MSAFWNKFTKGSQEVKGSDKHQKEQQKAVLKDTKEKKEKKGKKKDHMNKEKAQLFNTVLIKPVISENAMNQQAINKYVFEVGVASNKSEIAKAVEAMYGVGVTDVNVVRYKPLAHYFRMKRGASKGYKKAIVTIEKGQTIDLFTEQ